MFSLGQLFIYVTLLAISAINFYLQEHQSLIHITKKNNTFIYEYNIHVK